MNKIEIRSKCNQRKLLLELLLLLLVINIYFIIA